MAMDTLRDTMLLASSKRTLGKKTLYLLKGLVFLPFLINESKKVAVKDRAALAMSEAGEDIYPLF